ncbi:hypothetical protein H0H87_000730 [Tephrocybe sp. NHM501043]|nr:hypothetical protein H0H87_000730 [Tephrocybe sp. NHM501043]
MQKQSTPRAQKKINKVDEPTPIGGDLRDLEYAIERKILETPLLELSYFFDAPGEVPALPHYHENIGGESFEIGNGDVAPDWGFDIVINGGVLRYGPWADRQRIGNGTDNLTSPKDLGCGKQHQFKLLLEIALR